MKAKKVIDRKVKEFIKSYSKQELISYLDYFSNIIKKDDYRLLLKFMDEAQKACGIVEIKLNKSDSKTINYKRMVSHFSYNELHLSVGSISYLLKSSERSVNYYIKEADEYISISPFHHSLKRVNAFNKAYNHVLKNIKTE
jgi:hypothetical protein